MWKLVILTLLISCLPRDKFGPGTKWQIQFNGTIKDTKTPEVFELDLFNTDEEIITELKKKGKKIICYFSAGTFEIWRPDAFLFPLEVKGNGMKEWEGEVWLNIKDERVKNIMKKRMDLAKKKGCDAIDPDNVDGYTHPNGFKLTKEDQFNYNKFLAEEAHHKWLLIGLKNDLQQVKELVGYFDFAVNESCLDFNECHMLEPFFLYDKPILAISYKPKSKKACDDAKKFHLDLIFKNKKLDEKVEYCP